MSRQPLAVCAYLLSAVILTACASGAPAIIVPETKPGDQLLDEYMIGEWCTNREETANSNQAAGFSGLLNVSPVFWRFAAEGQWDGSTSGFMYNPIGNWQIVDLNTLQLSRKGVEPRSYEANFKSGETGADLYLTDDKGQFTVLSRCD